MARARLAAQYFADTPSKNDQYTTKDACKDAPDLHQLHEQLYSGPTSTEHPGDVQYILMCRVAMGCHVSTRPTWNMSKRFISEQTGDSVWAKQEKVLATIPGTDPPITYHSLVCRHGEGLSIQRHSEYLQFVRNRVYPAYLLACAFATTRIRPELACEPHIGPDRES